MPVSESFRDDVRRAAAAGYTWKQTYLTNQLGDGMWHAFLLTTTNALSNAPAIKVGVFDSKEAALDALTVACTEASNI